MLVPVAYLDVLKELHKFFGVGKIDTYSLNATFRVNRLADLAVIRNHFLSHPLLMNTDFTL